MCGENAPFCFCSCGCDRISKGRVATDVLRDALSVFVIVCIERFIARGAFRTLFSCGIDDMVATEACDENGYGGAPLASVG